MMRLLLNSQASKYKFEDRLDSIFQTQAEMLVDAGITDITQVGRKFDYGFDDAAPPRNYSGGFGGTDGVLTPVVTYRMYLIDKRTGKKLETSKSNPLQIADDSDTPVTIFDNQPADQVKLPPTQIWGSAKFGGGRDMFNVVFNDQNQPVFLPRLGTFRRQQGFWRLYFSLSKISSPFYIPVLGEALHSTAFGQAIGATASTVLLAVQLALLLQTLQVAIHLRALLAVLLGRLHPQPMPMR
jgi:hypothetical protein